VPVDVLRDIALQAEVELQRYETGSADAAPDGGGRRDGADADA
jgi:hypothetical protein